MRSTVCGASFGVNHRNDNGQNGKKSYGFASISVIFTVGWKNTLPQYKSNLKDRQSSMSMMNC